MKRQARNIRRTKRSSKRDPLRNFPTQADIEAAREMAAKVSPKLLAMMEAKTIDAR